MNRRDIHSKIVKRRKNRPLKVKVERKKKTLFIISTFK
jgi:hypothetical protein